MARIPHFFHKWFWHSLLLLVLMPFISVHASSGNVLFVSNLTSDYNGTYNYHATVSSIPTSADIDIPVVSQGPDIVYAGPWICRQPPGAGCQSIGGRTAIDTTKNITWRQAYELYQQEHPVPNTGTYSSNVELEPETCAGFGIEQGPDGAGGFGVGNGWSPGTSCSQTPPVNERCDFSQVALNIDHGSLSSDAISGAKASASFTINCTTQASVDITTSATNGRAPLIGEDLSSTVYSDLDFDGHTLTTPYIFTASEGSSPHSITSTLGTSGAPTGQKYTANVIVFMNIQ
jgi:hypothetical protein